MIVYVLWETILQSIVRVMKKWTMVIVWVKTLLIVTTVVIESSIILVSIILADLPIEVAENTTKIKDFRLVWSSSRT